MYLYIESEHREYVGPTGRVCKFSKTCYVVEVVCLFCKKRKFENKGKEWFTTAAWRLDSTHQATKRESRSDTTFSLNLSMLSVG